MKKTILFLVLANVSIGINPMKRKVCIMLLFLGGCLGMVGCGEKEKEICDCNDKTNSTEITNLSGIVYFKQDIQRWIISVHKEGTFDEVELFIPCNLEEAYREENKKVLFSGTTFDLRSNLNSAPAGSSYACVTISFINNLP